MTRSFSCLLAYTSTCQCTRTMAQSRSQSQAIHYRYRPNAPRRADTVIPPHPVSSADYNNNMPLSYSVSQMSDFSLGNIKQETMPMQGYAHAIQDYDQLSGPTLGTSYGAMDRTNVSFPTGFPSTEFPALSSPPLSSWISPDSSVTSDSCSASWSSPTSSISFSPEPAYQVSHAESPSWPTHNHASHFPANCVSMQEVFPMTVEPECVAPSIYVPHVAHAWPYQALGDNLPPVFDPRECYATQASPESNIEQTNPYDEPVTTVELRSNSLMSDNSTVSSPGFSVMEIGSISPQTSVRTQFEGQLLEFSTPVAQAKSKGAKSAALPCPLAAYGCTSSFISKNEWKRHINTQHLRLEAWLCDQCPKRDNKREFNRKDLFIQHLKRMHPAPISSSTAKAQPAKSKAGRSGSKSDKTARSSKGDDLDPALLIAEQRCHITLRQPPAESACLFCSTNFSGRGSWEARIEHVAKHMEQYKREGSEVPDPSTWRADRALEQWLISAGVISKVRQRWSIT